MIKDTPKGLPDSALTLKENQLKQKKKWWTHKML